MKLVNILVNTVVEVRQIAMNVGMEKIGELLLIVLIGHVDVEMDFMNLIKSVCNVKLLVLGVAIRKLVLLLIVKIWKLDYIVLKRQENGYVKNVTTLVLLAKITILLVVPVKN